MGSALRSDRRRLGRGLLAACALALLAWGAWAGAQAADRAAERASSERADYAAASGPVGDADASTDAPGTARLPAAGSVASPWTFNLQAWGYATRQSVAGDSVLNPGNRIAGVPRDLGVADLRLDAKYASERLDLVARPRVLEQDARGGVAGATTREDYFSQAYLRWRPQHAVAVTLGRDGFDWGPANLRSPSNPFYFDAGRTNPLRDVSGLDLARITAVAGADVLTGAYVLRSGHDVPGNPYRDTAVLKLDHRGEDSIASLVVAPQHHGAIFVGGYAQATIGEPWLVYAEVGSQRLPYALLAAATPTASQQYVLEVPSARAVASLAGVAYTLENGQTLTGELLHDGHGYAQAAERAYFDRAAQLDALRGPASAALGEALGQAPRLLSRHYLYLLWQSNPNLAGIYWRTGWTGNLDDHSGQISLYGEYNVAERVTLFGALTVDHGPRRAEFASVLHGALTLGAKLFVL